MKNLHIKDKKGIVSLGLIGVAFVGVFVLIAVAMMAYGMGEVDNALSSIDITLGNISFNETYTDNMKPSVISSQTTVPKTIALGTLIGMIIVLAIIGWKMPKINQVWIVFDVIVIIVAEIVAVILRESFTSFMNSSSEINTILTTTLSGSSTFILNLPIIIPSAGALLIAITYMKSKKPGEDF